MVAVDLIDCERFNVVTGVIVILSAIGGGSGGGGGGGTTPILSVSSGNLIYCKLQFYFCFYS